MKVLVACEESQAVCKAFRELGHEAYSCDIQECSGGHPEWHIQGDAKEACMSRKWDLIIAHPPCTRLCNSGQRWLYWGDAEYQAKKRKEQIEAVMFFMWFVNFAEITGTPMAIENPGGIMSSLYRKPDFTYNPYDFEGETECKKTCIWAFNGVEPLKPTQNLPKEQRTQNIWKAHFNGKSVSWNSPECAKYRSKTPAGVAKAMAEQWGGYIMKISDFIRINDSARTLYNVYRGDELVDIIEKDYLGQDPKLIPEATRRLNLLMDTNGYVERITPWYKESKSQIWLHVDVQIGAHDYPDRL